MSTIEPPTERTCERCGRREAWDQKRTTWSVAPDASEEERGRAHCLHEWDINGTYNPLPQ